MLWSRPMPLGWYFAEQWRRFFGNNWVEQLCDKFIIQDRFLKNFANELPVVSQHSLRILQLKQAASGCYFAIEFPQELCQQAASGESTLSEFCY
jgi:hypothetical protein